MYLFKVKRDKCDRTINLEKITDVSFFLKEQNYHLVISFENKMIMTFYGEEAKAIHNWLDTIVLKTFEKI